MFVFCLSLWREVRPSQFPAAGSLGTLEIPMLSIFRKLMKNEQGATAIEYTLIASDRKSVV